MNDPEENRSERDSLGEVIVPRKALYGAQTQRAIQNFQLSDLRFPRQFIRALGIIKGAAATVNDELGLLPAGAKDAIVEAAGAIANGDFDDHFPIDIFQTGSGTSTNMNANEVIANLASKIRGEEVHPNDHVNRSQSSNDVIPTAVHLSASLSITENLLPSLAHLHGVILSRAAELDDVVTTGRTHLMDAMPVSLGQIMGGWGHQIAQRRQRIESSLHQLSQLAQGGTAVGTGINAPPEFGAAMAGKLTAETGISFAPSDNYFASLSSPDAVVDVSGQLKGLAVVLTKISNDLRWMNSGPNAGLGEISLTALQPGSSIMPGKVNPVIPEAVAMACAQVIGNDVTITLGGQSGNFQLNVMLPVIAYNLLQSIDLLANSCSSLADKAISDFTVNRKRIAGILERNPILITALNAKIGYEKGSELAKLAFREGRSIKEVVLEHTDFTAEDLDRLLDPMALTKGGIPE